LLVHTTQCILRPIIVSSTVPELLLVHYTKNTVHTSRGIFSTQYITQYRGKMRGTVRRWKAGEILFQTMSPLPMQFFRCAVFIISKIRWFLRWKFFINLINLKLTFICFSIPLKTLQQCLIINHQRFLYFKLLMQRNLSKSDKSFRDFQKESFYQKSLRRRIFFYLLIKIIF